LTLLFGGVSAVITIQTLVWEWLVMALRRTSIPTQAIHDQALAWRDQGKEAAGCMNAVIPEDQASDDEPHSYDFKKRWILQSYHWREQHRLHQLLPHHRCCPT